MSARAETEFLPAVLEVQDTPPSPAGRAILWGILAFVSSAVGWAWLGEVDIVAVAQGRIIPSGHSKTVQPLELGTVVAIHVAEGQAVRAGEVLIELDPSSARADVQRLQHEQQLAQDELARIDNLAAWLADDGVPAAEQGSSSDALLRSQWREFQDRLAVLASERDRLSAERAGVGRQVDKLADVLPLVARRARDQQGLAEQKLLPEQQFLETEQQRLEIHHDLRTQRARVAELDAAIGELDARSAYTRSEFRRQVLERREQAGRRLTAARQELVKASARLRAQSLRAPVDGVVQQLAVHGIGTVVTPAQQLLVIVPQDQALEVEAILENKDIGFVEAGQAAAIKVDAFPFTKYGTIDGKVNDLSADALADEHKGLVYKMRVALAATAIDVNGKAVGLSPGMAVTVEAKTGTRRVIEYFLGPLLRYADESARER